MGDSLAPAQLPEITIPYLNERLEALEKENKQLLDKLAQNEKWKAITQEALSKLSRVLGV